MKTATFLAFVLSLPATAAWSQATSPSANAATRTGDSVQMGHDASLSQASNAGANASASRQNLTGSANESADAATHAGNIKAGAMQASNVSAELAQKIDSKNAKVGDDVVARTTSAAQIEGTKLPKGTRLVGKVTEVQPKSHEQHDGHLAFAFDRAVLRDGREIPIHATLRAISAPVSAAGMTDASDDLGAGPVAARTGGSVRGGSGLLGGGGAAVAQTSGLVGGATSAVASTPAHVAGVADGTLRTSTGLMSATGASAAVVTNLPGVNATASDSGSAMLQSSGRNVELSGGTQLVLGVSAR